uniref:hypothetical protein n=1 Tax=Leyella stercorea TaxID=363265 RepID=UPI003FF138F8
MKKNKILPILFLGILASTNGFAQNNNPRKTYDDFKKQALQKYNDFRTQANEQYAVFLKQAWEQYNALPAITKPKDETVPPVTIPEEDKNKPIESNPIPIKDVVVPPTPDPQPTPIAPIKEDSQPQERAVEFIYCGTKYQVHFNKDLNLSLHDCNNEQLSNVWTQLSAEGVLNSTIRDCLAIRVSKKMCDWAYLNLLSSFSKAIYGTTNEATMLTSYIFSQSGYKMRIGRNRQHLYLLYASEHGIYEIPYFNIDDLNFYPFECNETQLEICDASFPQEKPLSLFIPQNPKFEYKASDLRTLTSKRYPNVQVQIQVNENLIDFYNTYPASEVNGNFMTKWAMYANTPLDEHVKEKLYPALMDKINGLSQLDAVNKLLNWVQTAFVYEYDDKVWGHDRAFFAEETLYYPYCDCEDRAILFTRLVRDLLGLKTILVFYPGHLASAVCFTDKVAGDYIMLDGKRFIITDPTYIGAPVGKTMPDMDNTQASVILLN